MPDAGEWSLTGFQLSGPLSSSSKADEEDPAEFQRPVHFHAGQLDLEVTVEVVDRTARMTMKVTRKSTPDVSNLCSPQKPCSAR